MRPARQCHLLDVIGGERLHLVAAQQPGRAGILGDTGTQHELDGEQVTARGEQRPHAGDGIRPQGPGEGLHGEDVDDQVEPADEVDGQVEQVGHPVVDRTAGMP